MAMSEGSIPKSSDFVKDCALTVKRISEYSVRIPSDKFHPFIIGGICSLPSGQVIVSDFVNRKVKLLDQHYNVSSYIDVSGQCHICTITSFEVAVVTLKKEVQFISVSNGQLVNGRKLQLQHEVKGIAHHQGALYVTSGTSLYHYSLTGSLVKELYQGASASNTVHFCAVSPAGDRIYVTNTNEHKLLTLTTDGTLISTFEHPELQSPCQLHVLPTGHVLVIGSSSQTVIQVDSEGRQKLATLASQKDRLGRPMSVCYNTFTHQIIVGFNANSEIPAKKIIVMDLK